MGPEQGEREPPQAPGFVHRGRQCVRRPLAITVPDPDHSSNEQRFITIGLSWRSRYDLRQLLKGGVRGKYAKGYHSGTNLVLLDPDIRRAFRSERAVNEALRLVIELRKVGSKKAV
jgi:hypothetical protein